MQPEQNGNPGGVLAIFVDLQELSKFRRYSQAESST